MDAKGIVLWAVFLAVFAAGTLYSKRLKKQISEDGIEVVGTVSRVVDDGSAGEIDVHVYARYRTEDGGEVEGVVSNAPSDLVPGQQVRLRYHPRHRTNARLVEVLGE